MRKETYLDLGSDAESSDDEDKLPVRRPGFNKRPTPPPGWANGMTNEGACCAGSCKEDHAPPAHSRTERAERRGTTPGSPKPAALASRGRQEPAFCSDTTPAQKAAVQTIPPPSSIAPVNSERAVRRSGLRGRESVVECGRSFVVEAQPDGDEACSHCGHSDSVAGVDE